MARRITVKHLLRGVDPVRRERASVLRRFYNTVGMVHFGTVHQHDDEYDAIRGFSASLTHHDEHYAVGSYNDYDIRMVQRTETNKHSGQATHTPWLILEVSLRVRNMPHIFFLPAGHEGDGYRKLFAEQPYMQPISSFLSQTHYSPEFHGRYQILARSTRAHDVNELITSPIIVGIGARFWPYGIEIEHGNLYIYDTDKKLSNGKLETMLASALWLADNLRSVHVDSEA